MLRYTHSILKLPLLLLNYSKVFLILKFLVCILCLVVLFVYFLPIHVYLTQINFYNKFGITSLKDDFKVLWLSCITIYYLLIKIDFPRWCFITRRRHFSNTTSWHFVKERSTNQFRRGFFIKIPRNHIGYALNILTTAWIEFTLESISG